MASSPQNSTETKCFILLWWLYLHIYLAQTRELDPRWKSICPLIYPNTLVGFAPRGNDSAGIYTKKVDVHSLEMCIKTCCADNTCNVVFMHEKTCYQIECETNELCMPLRRPEENFGTHVTMILVRPVLPSETWGEIIDLPWPDDYVSKDNLMESAATHFLVPDNAPCEVGILVDCSENEECVQMVQHSRSGVCHCVKGYQRNITGMCQPVVSFTPLHDEHTKPINMAASASTVSLMNDNMGEIMKHSKGNLMFNNTNEKPLHVSLLSVTQASLQPTKMYSEGELFGGTDHSIPEATSSHPIKHLVVSAISKEVRLPENEATLSAYTVPAEQPGEHYKYEWMLLSQPDGVNRGTMNDQNGETLKLSNLIEGLYMFKVSVSAPGAYGETYANVTVLPRGIIDGICVSPLPIADHQQADIDSSITPELQDIPQPFISTPGFCPAPDPLMDAAASAPVKGPRHANKTANPNETEETVHMSLYELQRDVLLRQRKVLILKERKLSRDVQQGDN